MTLNDRVTGWRNPAVLLLAALHLAGCQRDATVPELLPARVVVDAGDRQIGTASQPLPDTLVVRVMDASGAPIANVTTEWAPSHGTVSLVNVRTDAAGYARATWMLASGPAIQTIAVRAGTAEATITARLEHSIGDFATLNVVSGNGQKGAAGVFLPETLTVVVRDTAGQPLRNVAVDWYPHPQAEIRSLDARSRADGTVRALWKLRPTLETQSVLAFVGETDLRASFTASVRVTAIAVEPRRLVLWPDDTVVIDVTPRDARGNHLSGDVTLKAVAAGIARVRHDTVIAERVGTTTILARTPDLDHAIPVTVKPRDAGQQLGGRLRALLPADFDDVTVTIRSQSGQASAAVATDGQFVVTLREPVAASDSIDLEVVPGSNSGVLPARFQFVFADYPAEVLVMPSHWTIRGGTYAGRTVPISVKAALESVLNGGSYWWGSAEPHSERMAVDLQTWHPDSMPIRVFISRRHSVQPPTDADSAGLWSRLRQLEEYLGTSLFEPVRFDEPAGVCSSKGVVTPCQPDRSIRVRFLAAGAGASGGAFSVSGQLERETRAFNVGPGAARTNYVAALIHINGGDVAVPVNAPAATVWHEFLHALGVLHGCGWPSLQAYCVQRTSVPTPEDVAHWQVLQELRRQSTTIPVVRSVMATFVAERLRAGLPPLP